MIWNSVCSKSSKISDILLVIIWVIQLNAVEIIHIDNFKTDSNFKFFKAVFNILH